MSNLIQTNEDLVQEEKSQIITWAENELELAFAKRAEDEDDLDYNYNKLCAKSALKALKSLDADGHSGLSISVTQRLLNRLIDQKPLTAIEDVPEVWNNVSKICNGDGSISALVYQCKRMSSLFKKVYSDGTVKYNDNDAVVCVEINNPNATYHSGLVQRIVDEMFPITMPYLPKDKPITVYCSECLTDRANGDFDTVGILSAVKPNGQKIKIFRFFKESEKDWVEIDEKEFIDRQVQSYKRAASEENKE